MYEKARRENNLRAAAIVTLRSLYVLYFLDLPDADYSGDYRKDNEKFQSFFVVEERKRVVAGDLISEPKDAEKPTFKTYRLCQSKIKHLTTSQFL